MDPLFSIAHWQLWDRIFQLMETCWVLLDFMFFIDHRRSINNKKARVLWHCILHIFLGDLVGEKCNVFLE